MGLYRVAPVDSPPSAPSRIVTVPWFPSTRMRWTDEIAVVAQQRLNGRGRHGGSFRIEGRRGGDYATRFLDEIARDRLAFTC